MRESLFQSLTQPGLQEDLLGNGMLMIIISIDPHRPQTIKKMV
jgi:hypothetical protein